MMPRLFDQSTNRNHTQDYQSFTPSRLGNSCFHQSSSSLRSMDAVLLGDRKRKMRARPSLKETTSSPCLDSRWKVRLDNRIDRSSFIHQACQRLSTRIRICIPSVCSLREEGRQGAVFTVDGLTRTTCNTLPMCQESHKTRLKTQDELK